MLFLVSGVLIVVVAYALFGRVRQSADQPPVDGRAYLYLTSRDVVSVLSLAVKDGNTFKERPEVEYHVAVVGQPGQTTRWALVLAGDARIREGRLAITSAGVDMVETQVASPPLGGTPVDVQIYHGETRGGVLGDTAFDAPIKGELYRPVAHIAEARRSMALPLVGRTSTPPLFKFPEAPLPIGVPGSWFIPEKFEATVSLGPRPARHRVDVVAPDLDDQRQYRWSSGTSVHVVLAVTDTDQERVEEIVVFLIGVLSALGAGAVLVAAQQRAFG